MQLALPSHEARRRDFPERGKRPCPVRVAFLIDELSIAGTETQLLRLIQGLNRELVSPYLCLLRGESAHSRALEPPGCPVLRLGVGSLHRPTTLGKALAFARFLKLERIEILQAYFPDSTYFGTVVAKLAGVPHVVRVRNNLNHWMTPAHRVLGRLVNRLLSATAVNCEACQEAVRASDRLAWTSIVVLENGVDLERFLRITPVAGERTHGPRVGVVANLRAVKGVGVFIRAAGLLGTIHPDLQFAIAGEGEERPGLEELVRVLNLEDRVRFHGSVKDVPGFLEGLQVAVNCSRSEGMSNAVLEYMAAGRAIVGSAVGATPQLLQDGVHGLLVPPENSEALARAVDRLLRDPALARRLGMAARVRARERYSREAMIRRFENFYLRMVRN